MKGDNHKLGFVLTCQNGSKLALAGVGIVNIKEEAWFVLYIEINCDNVSSFLHMLR